MIRMLFALQFFFALLYIGETGIIVDTNSAVIGWLIGAIFVFMVFGGYPDEEEETGS